MPISLVIIVPKREEKLIQALGLGNPGPIGTTLTNLINGTILQHLKCRTLSSTSMNKQEHIAAVN